MRAVKAVWGYIHLRKKKNKMSFIKNAANTQAQRSTLRATIAPACHDLGEDRPLSSPRPLVSDGLECGLARCVLDIAWAGGAGAHTGRPRIVEKSATKEFCKVEKDDATCFIYNAWMLLSRKCKTPHCCECPELRFVRSRNA